MQNKYLRIKYIQNVTITIYRQKNYTKKMLDLLVMLLNYYQLNFKINLAHLGQLHQQIQTYTITNIIKLILTKNNAHSTNSQNAHLLNTLATKYEQMKYKKMQDIRIYKKYVLQNKIIMIQFNQDGILSFISGKKDNQYINQLIKIWESGKPILNQIFIKFQQVNNNIKKAINGLLKCEKPIQIGNNLKIKIIAAQKKIQKIQLTIQQPQNANTIQQIQLQQNKKKKQNNIEIKYPSNDNYLKLRTMKQLSRQHSRLSQDGCGKTKNQITIDKNKFHLLKKKIVKTLNFSIYHDPKVFRKSSTLIPTKKQPRKIGIQQISINDTDLNFLTFANHSLQLFAIKVLNNLHYFQKLPQSQNKLNNFISQLHINYQTHSNPFHNFKHAINVMHTCYLLSTLQANIDILTQKDIFAIVFSGLCHDVGHTGYTNAFQVASMSNKALTYNDKSPLQNYHAYLTFQILKKNNNNFLSHLPYDQFLGLRKSVIEIILLTDMREHFTILNNFNQRIKNPKIFGKQDVPLLSAMIVHSSDFSGSIKEFQISRIWSLKINQQFSNQYKKQGQIGIPQTPFMKDLSNPLILSNSQIRFLKMIVYPLYQTIDKFYIQEMMTKKFKQNIQDNIKNWDQIISIYTHNHQSEEFLCQ